MVVILELMANSDHDHVRCGLDVHERDVARASEGDDQFAQEGALAGLAASERGRSQRLEAGTDGRNGLFGQREVTAVPRQFALDDEVEQAIEVVGGPSGLVGAEAHSRGLGD